MRAFFLSLIVLSEILIAATDNADINKGALSLLATMIFVVLVSFTFSAILNKVKSITLTRNYSISGIIGVVLGVFFYMWVDSNINSTLLWLEAYGLYFLLLLIFISALVLYFFKGNDTKKSRANSLSKENEGVDKTDEKDQL